MAAHSKQLCGDWKTNVLQWFQELLLRTLHRTALSWTCGDSSAGGEQAASALAVPEGVSPASSSVAPCVCTVPAWVVFVNVAQNYLMLIQQPSPLHPGEWASGTEDTFSVFGFGEIWNDCPVPGFVNRRWFIFIGWANYILRNNSSILHHIWYKLHRKTLRSAVGPNLVCSLSAAPWRSNVLLII